MGDLNFGRGNNNLSRNTTLRYDIGNTSCLGEDTSDDIWEDFDFAVELGAQVRERERLEAATRFVPTKPRSSSLSPSIALSINRAPSPVPYLQQAIVGNAEPQSKNTGLGYSTSDQLKESAVVINNSSLSTPYQMDIPNSEITRKRFSDANMFSLNQSLPGKDVTESCSYDSGYGSSVALKKDIGILSSTGPENTISTKKDSESIFTFNKTPSQETMLCEPAVSYEKGYTHPWKIKTVCVRLDLNRVKRMEQFQDDEKMDNTTCYNTNLRVLNSALSIKSSADRQHFAHNGSSFNMDRKDECKNSAPHRLLHVRRQKPQYDAADSKESPTGLSQMKGCDINTKVKQDPKWMSELRHKSEFRENGNLYKVGTAKLPDENSSGKTGLVIDEWLAKNARVSQTGLSRPEPAPSLGHFSTREGGHSKPDRSQDIFPDRCPTEADLLNEIKDSFQYSSDENKQSPSKRIDNGGCLDSVPRSKLSEADIDCSKGTSTHNGIKYLNYSHKGSLPTSRIGVHQTLPALSHLTEETDTASPQPSSFCPQIKASRTPDQPTSPQVSQLRSNSAMLDVSGFSERSLNARVPRKRQSHLIEVLSAPSDHSPTLPSISQSKMRRFKERVTRGFRRLKTNFISVVRTLTSCSH